MTFGSAFNKPSKADLAHWNSGQRSQSLGDPPGQKDTGDRPKLNPDQFFNEKPDWGPLEHFAKASKGKINPDDFMHMGTFKAHDQTLQLYKHSDTRKYLNIDEKGYAYQYKNGRYDPLPSPQAAVDHVTSW